MSDGPKEGRPELPVGVVWPGGVGPGVPEEGMGKSEGMSELWLPEGMSEGMSELSLLKKVGTGGKLMLAGKVSFSCVSMGGREPSVSVGMMILPFSSCVTMGFMVEGGAVTHSAPLQKHSGY